MTKHGHKRRSGESPTYCSWQKMLNRCRNPNHDRFASYGGRGVRVCLRWQGRHGFENFLADLGERPEGTTLDRFPDADGDYKPGNVRWASPAQQAQNRSTTKLTQQQARQLRRAKRRGLSFSAVAAQFGISKRLARDVVSGRHWKETR